MTETKKPEPIRIEWATGHYELLPDFITACTPAKLRKLMKQATKNAGEADAAVRACIEDARKAAQHDKKERARLGKLLEVLAPPKKKTAAARVAERIAKRSPSASYAGVFTSGGWHCVCDGYTLLCLNVAPDLPTVPGGLNAAKTIDDAARDGVPLPLPSLAEVKSLLRIAKSAPRGSWLGQIYPEKGRTLYDFGGGLPLVDLAFLRDVLEALPGACAVWTSDRAPLVFRSADGQAILLPVNPNGPAGQTRSAAPIDPAEAQKAGNISARKPEPVREVFTPAEFAAHLDELEISPAEFAALLAA